MSENPFRDSNGYLPYTGEQPKGEDGKPLSYFDVQVREFQKEKGETPATATEIANIYLRGGY